MAEITGQRLDTLFRLTGRRPAGWWSPPWRRRPRKCSPGSSSATVPTTWWPAKRWSGTSCWRGSSGSATRMSRWWRTGGPSPCAAASSTSSLPGARHRSGSSSSATRWRPSGPLTRSPSAPCIRLEELVLLPSREVILSEEVIAAFTPRLKPRCDELDIPPSRRREYLEQLATAAYPLRDRVSPAAVPSRPGDALRLSGHRRGDGAARPGRAGGGGGTAGGGAGVRRWPGPRPAAPWSAVGTSCSSLPLLPPTWSQGGGGSAFPELDLAEGRAATVRFRSEENRDLKADVSRDTEHALMPLVNRLREWRDRGWRTIFVCHHQGQAERLLDLFSHYPVSPVLSERDFPSGGDPGRRPSRGPHRRDIPGVPPGGGAAGGHRRGGDLRQTDPAAGHLRGAQEADSLLPGGAEAGGLHRPC